jgi:pimeloyl-ACP methyl ester carboxylesterase
MPLFSAPPDPPPIEGVRRSRARVRGVDFHVTEAGAAAGAPVLLLHGWPENHYVWRHLLADPPAGLRLIAPDLPGYGWSGPPPHRWQKEEVASDILALLDELAVERAVLAGHDWGGYVGYLLALRAPERFSAYMAMNIPHPWQNPSTLLPHIWRFLGYQPLLALFGVPIQRFTPLLPLAIRSLLVDKQAVSDQELSDLTARFKHPSVAAAGRDTYRTLWFEEIPAQIRHPERRRLHVPTRVLFGKSDGAIHHSLVSADTANADDYEVELVPGAGHFIADEKPQLVRQRLIALTEQFPPA